MFGGGREETADERIYRGGRSSRAHGTLHVFVLRASRTMNKKYGVIGFGTTHTGRDPGRAI